MRSFKRRERISHSEIAAHLLCERKHWYMYLRGLKRTAAVSDAAARGTLFHECIEVYGEHRLAGDSHELAMSFADLKLTSLTNFENIGIAAEVKKLLAFFTEANPLEEYEWLAVEKKFSVPLDGDVVHWVGALDIIVRDKFGKIAVVDYKTTGRRWSETRLILDSQIPEYIAAVHLNGKPMDYGLIIQVRTQYAKDAKANDVIIPTKVKVNEAHEANVWKGVMRTAYKILGNRVEYDAGNITDPVRSPTDMGCSMCPMKELCISDLKGWDSDLLIGSHFVVQEEREYEV